MADLGWDPLIPWIEGRLWGIDIGDVYDGTEGSNWYNREETALYDLQNWNKSVDLLLVNQAGAYQGGGFEHENSGWNEPTDMICADLNNDGIDEIIVAAKQLNANSPEQNPGYEYPGELKVYNATDGTEYSWQVTYLLEDIDVHDVAVADMNADGFKDILYAADGKLGVVYVLPPRCTDPPAGDTTGDCLVNMDDLADVASTWLMDTRNY